ncbi:hypothetical protein BC835DRAFT_1366801 [Cytidiella melzeri]|nr:hypothetical protein BC835DRAFT_1366801 [Cytidiella melzeri]
MSSSKHSGSDTVSHNNLECISATNKLTSLQTSSTLTVQTDDPQAGVRSDSNDLPWHRTSGSNALELEHDHPTYRLLRPRRTGRSGMKISKLVRMIFACDLHKVRSGALVAMFTFTQDESSSRKSVLNAMAILPDVELLTVLQRLAEFESALPDRARSWQDKRWTSESRQDFLTHLLRRRWHTLDFNGTQSVCNSLRVGPSVLKLLFPLPDQDKRKPAQHIHHIFTYLATPYVEWPSLAFLEENHFLWPPPKWPVTHIARVLPKRDSPVTATLVEHILRATRPNAQFDPTDSELLELQRLMDGNEPARESQRYTPADYRCRHPASPFLWFALYLAYENHFAARSLVHGGFIDNIRALYDLGFPDPRVTGKDLKGVALQSSHDLTLLCYMTLRCLFRHDEARNGNASVCGAAPIASGKQRTTYTRAWEQAESLKEFNSCVGICDAIRGCVQRGIMIRMPFTGTSLRVNSGTFCFLARSLRHNGFCSALL